ncbi:unnamed protein product [Heligmosomoides polygyrus]|uniref:AB hydrolase-1 domain-containing protein n=1 Tax=Heligmosomoides polygyrus TaxID=6339 RepID=A0A183G745_HELPZ|nr:unnamed protein product [Heligmosomoides polygyrus]
MFSLPRIGFCYVLTVTSLRQRVYYRFASGRSVFDQENGLFSVPVRFKNNRGDTIQLDAVYQDTMPDGGEKAVLFALHGSPGSHADFKYLAPELKKNGVRMVMPNYPGMGYTAGDLRLSCENEERNEFTQAVLDSLDNVQSPHLYFIGHSRGGENALQMATSPLNVKKVRGVVMLNAAGLRIHRGIEPPWKVELFVKLLDLRVFNIVVHPLLYFVYNQVLGLRAPSGAAAAMALRSMQTFAFDSLLPCIRLLHAYSGDDFLIQTDVSKEFASKLERRIELECSADDSAAITRSTIEAFSSGYQAVSVNFTNEGHFLQKFRAKYLVDVILSLTRI